mmetsp:Transcript_61536/g.169095  ORF Transcript_61536/g.169095 Transcript_61536/m.169095 type:complete len:202 (+) Transcript_61536:2378-2983(+)
MARGAHIEPRCHSEEAVFGARYRPHPPVALSGGLCAEDRATALGVLYAEHGLDSAVRGPRFNAHYISHHKAHDQTSGSRRIGSGPTSRLAQRIEDVEGEVRENNEHRLFLACYLCCIGSHLQTAQTTLAKSTLLAPPMPAAGVGPKRIHGQVLLSLFAAHRKRRSTVPHTTTATGIAAVVRSAAAATSASAAFSDGFFFFF